MQVVSKLLGVGLLVACDGPLQAIAASLGPLDWHLVEALQLLQRRHALFQAEVPDIVALEQVAILEAPVADAVEVALAVRPAQVLQRQPRLGGLLS